MVDSAELRETMPSPDQLEQLRSWVGRQETVDEIIAPMPSAALGALLDNGDPAPSAGDVAPLGHWLHLLPIHRQSQLAQDGHAHRGGFMPPVPLPRRMFAGARIKFMRPLRIGSAARRVGTVTAVTPKTGRSGPLVFVGVRQEISDQEGPVLVEEQDIVYRTMPRRSQQTPAVATSPANAMWRREVAPDERVLFRYSALIFNAHRIHYDRRYTTEHEGYPGLVVHGQLVATYLADLMTRATGSALASFTFRAVRASFANSPLILNGTREGPRARLWASDAHGAVAMEAEAELVPPENLPRLER